jgi:hypothetical protein
MSPPLRTAMNGMISPSRVIEKTLLRDIESKNSTRERHGQRVVDSIMGPGGKMVG